MMSKKSKYLNISPGKMGKINEESMMTGVFDKIYLSSWIEHVPAKVMQTDGRRINYQTSNTIGAWKFNFGAASKKKFVCLLNIY